MSLTCAAWLTDLCRSSLNASAAESFSRRAALPHRYFSITSSDNGNCHLLVTFGRGELRYRVHSQHRLRLPGEIAMTSSEACKNGIPAALWTGLKRWGRPAEVPSVLSLTLGRLRRHRPDPRVDRNFELSNFESRPVQACSQNQDRLMENRTRQSFRPPSQPLLSSSSGRPKEHPPLSCRLCTSSESD